MPADEAEAVRRHIRCLASSLRQTLRSQENTKMLGQALQRLRTDQHSKSGALFTKLLHPGPPVHIGLGCI
eukprot:22705-Karenia_brevis.AAC.1